MPLPFEFEGKGVVLLKNQQQYEEEDQEATFVVPYANPLVHFQNFVIDNKKTKYNNEPTSVLENITTSPSPPASISTTLSSSHGGAADSAGLASLSYSTNKWLPVNQENLPENQDFENPLENQEIATGNLKCVGMEDWENGDSGQDQAMLRWIMGDVEDPSIGLNKILHSTPVTDGAGTVTGVSSSDFEFNGVFGVVDQGFIGNLSNPQLSPAPAIFQTHHQNQIYSPLNDTQMLPFDIKPNLFNLQTQTYNSGNIEYNPPKHKKLAPINHQQGIIDQLFKAAELIQSENNPILAQEILARLNHQLSPIGKPFERASFYFKEALNLLTHSVLNNINPQITPTCSPFSLIFKISAYKSFSEISPFVQFANFTCNQALLESLNGFDRIHIIDFDIGYGGQWASLMQELALRNNGVSSLKITAFASPLTHDQLELGLTRENLIHFASEINVGFEFEIVNIDVLANSSWSLPFNLSDNNEAIAVNLPIHVLSNHQTQIPSVLRFVKSLNPKIVVSVDRGCDRTDLPFSNHMIHALQSYSNLLQSLDAVNMNLDSSQKIERFLIQPAIEKIVLGRFLFPEKTQHWQNLFFSAGFSPLLFSNFTESQAECLVKRTPVHEFHVEKRQSLLVLCWQRRELVSASAWRC